MLFRRKIAKSCAYCIHGILTHDGQVNCSKKGIRSIDQKCRKFKYDPVKRIPPRSKALDFDKYNNEDFSL